MYFKRNQTNESCIFGIVAPSMEDANRILRRIIPNEVLDSSADIFKSDALPNVGVESNICAKFSNGCVLMRGTQFNFSPYRDNQFHSGYTMIIPNLSLGKRMLNLLTKTERADNADEYLPPIEIAASEYESLRIEVRSNLK